IAYTDGVTEAMNGKNELFGNDRLLNVVQRISNRDIQTTCNAIMDDVVFFADKAPQSDDITILCLQYSGDNKGL
ncbi:MAG TPA: SpoIIE family protein phosphatase, partial [Nitrospirae bacterium]|nr:SpoIIE family protein phosphatase [Nitrospirota bacterium]